MMTLAIAQSQSGPLYFAGSILVLLLTLGLLYLWIGEKRDYIALLPTKRDFIKRGKNLLLPYTERFAEDIENGDKVVIQGKLSRGVQIGLKTVLWLLYIAIGVTLILNLLNSEDAWYGLWTTALIIGIQIVMSIRIAHVLHRAKRKIIQYYPPMPKQQPYFDYKGDRITGKQIKQWQNEVRVWLPMYLLIGAAFVFLIYKRYFN